MDEQLQRGNENSEISAVDAKPLLLTRNVVLDGIFEIEKLVSSCFHSLWICCHCGLKQTKNTPQPRAAVLLHQSSRLVVAALRRDGVGWRFGRFSSSPTSAAPDPSPQPRSEALLLWGPKAPQTSTPASPPQNTLLLTRGLTHGSCYFCDVLFKDRTVTEDSRVRVCTTSSALTPVNSAQRAVHQLSVMP